ncbi:hypothetical protein TNCV_2326741 [Trichonephila clavipes]|nr:hypothetical protein TNCV_2326741 [Trichonephila clavipes]
MQGPAFDLFVILTIMMKIKNKNKSNVVALVHPGPMRIVSSIRIAKHTSRWAEVCRPRRIDPRRERRLLLTVRPDRKAISADISCSFYNSDSRQCTSTHSEPYTAAYGPTQPPLKSHNPADGMSSPTAPATSRVTSVMDHIRIEEWCRYYGWHRYYNMGVVLMRHIRTPRLHRTIIDVCALREHHCRPGAPVHGNSIPCE